MEDLPQKVCLQEQVWLNIFLKWSTVTGALRTSGSRAREQQSRELSHPLPWGQRAGEYFYNRGVSLCAVPPSSVWFFNSRQELERERFEKNAYVDGKSLDIGWHQFRCPDCLQISVRGVLRFLVEAQMGRVLQWFTMEEMMACNHCVCVWGGGWRCSFSLK